MKKLLLITVLLLSIVSCKKEKSPTPTLASPVVVGMTTLETSLTGKWLWDKDEVYSGGVLTTTYDHTTHPMCAGAYMDLRTTFYMGATTTPQLYDELALSNGTSPTSTSWYITPIGSFPKAYLNAAIMALGSSGSYIDSVSSTTLILTDWSGSIPNGSKHFYHK